MKQKTALLVDSGIDVPPSIIKEYGIYSLPLKIIYKDREYSDGVDIQAEEVYNKPFSRDTKDISSRSS